MKRCLFYIMVLLPVAYAFSQQNAYDKCVEECIRAGHGEATCASEICNLSDTAVILIPDHGSPLLLPSYELKGPAPVIDGSLMSRDGNPSTSEAMDEWKEACSRTLLLDDSGVVNIFLCNSKDTLYIGLTYEHNNDGDGCGVRLLFDEGKNVLPSSQYDGSTDLKLSASNGVRNEQGCGVYKSGGGVILEDLSWNGTAWVNDGDGEKNFRGAKAYFNSDKKVHHNEFAIPLNNGKSDDTSNSDLNVSYDDVIGFYLEVIKKGAGAGTWHWLETNGQPTRPDTFPNWARIQLSVKREFFTFYTGSSSTSPVMDGVIDEPVWNGAYQRELILSNYHYGYYQSKIWCLEDSARNSIFVGLRVFDKVNNPDDYCQIYLEEDGTDTTSAIRNYILDNNAESALRTTNGSQFSDYFWNINNNNWAAVTETDNQTGKSRQFTGYTDYEFRIRRAGGKNHIDIPKGGLLGLLIRYHDADNAAEDLSNYYWEYTTNNDAQLLDQQSHPNVYISTGWTNLQLGGPYLQIIKPATPDEISGIVKVEVSSGTDSLKSVVCYLAGDTTIRANLVYQGGGVWTGTIDVSQAAGTGDLDLVIQAVTESGITVQRMVNKANPFISVKHFSTRYTNQFSVDRVSWRGMRFLINMRKSGALTMEMYSMTGKKVWSNRIVHLAQGWQMVNLSSDFSKLGNGAYMMAIKNGNERITKKIMVSR